MKIFRDKKAQGNAVSWFVGVAIAVIIALQVAWPVIDGAVSGGAYSVGNLTFSNSVSNGEKVYITQDGGIVNCFNFNTSSTLESGGACHTVPAVAGQTATIAGVNLTVAINADTSINGVLVATNPSVGVVKITSLKKSAFYNTYGTTETAANGAWGAATMTGGITDASAMPATAQALIALIALFLALSVIMIFVRPLL